MKNTTYNGYNLKIDERNGTITKAFPSNKQTRWETEVSAYQMLSQLKFSKCPRMIDYGTDKAVQFIQLEYIIPDHDISQQEKVRLMSLTLREFHSLDFKSCDKSSILNNFKFYESSLTNAIPLLLNMKEVLESWGFQKSDFNILINKIKRCPTLNDFQLQVVHRDIRFDNFVFQKDCAFIIDFENMALGNNSFDISRFIWRELKNESNLQEIFKRHYFSKSIKIHNFEFERNKTLFAIEMLDYFFKTPEAALLSKDYILEMIEQLKTNKCCSL